MRKCHIYLKNKDCPILVVGYIGHKIRKRGFSEFYGMARTYYIWNKDIESFSIDVEKGESEVKPNELNRIL